MDWISKVNQEKMVEWRRYLHQHAELSFEEVETSQYIYDTLSSFEGIEVIRPTKTSVVGILKGALPGKTVGLRADIDALPIEEEADVEFKSLNKGVMHACGHDAHAAMLLGAAYALSQMQKELKGTVKFIFQHAEEKTPGGAQEIVNTKVLDDVDFFFGEHVRAGSPVGVIGSAVGSVSAAQDSVIITIKGKGAHGSRPHTSIDPVTIGAELVLNFNNIIARNVSPLDNAVITVGKFAAGTVCNVIPDTAVLEITVRTFTEEIRELLENRIRTVTDGICKAYGATYDIDYLRGYSAVINDEYGVDIIKKVATELLGEDSYFVMPKAMGSEDFSAYLSIAPGAFVTIGTGTEEDGYLYGGHHPKFKIDESALSIGAKVYIGCALKINE